MNKNILASSSVVDDVLDEVSATGTPEWSWLNGILLAPHSGSSSLKI